MNVEVRKQRNRAELVFEDEGYTLLNLLRTVLLEDEGVEAANYRVDPTIGRKPVFTVVAKRDPLDAVEGAASRIAARCDELLGLLKKG